MFGTAAPLMRATASTNVMFACRIAIEKNVRPTRLGCDSAHLAYRRTGAEMGWSLVLFLDRDEKPKP